MSVDERLYKAIARGDAVAVETLLAGGCSSRDRDPDGFTALMHAVLVEACSPQVIGALIRAGSEVNARDNGQQWTALAFAARDGKAEICEMLLAAGAEVDPVDTFGNTPLWRAASGRKMEVVELLLRQGANLALPNRRGISAGHILGGS